VLVTGAVSPVLYAAVLRIARLPLTVSMCTYDVALLLQAQAVRLDIPAAVRADAKQHMDSVPTAGHVVLERGHHERLIGAVARRCEVMHSER
jgi:hypothetical protein